MSTKRNKAPEIRVGDLVKIVRLNGDNDGIFEHLIGKQGTVDFIATPASNAKNVVEVMVDGYGFFACSARELEVVA